MAKKETKHNNLPVRNTVFEALIIAAAIGMFAYAFITLSMMYTLLALGSSVDIVSLLYLIVSITVFVQATTLIKQRQRVDRYVQRLVAALLICILPLLFFFRYFMAGLLSRMLSESTSITNSSEHWLYTLLKNLHSGMSFNVILLIAIVAIIWLWIILRKKDKLFWVLEGSPRTKDYKVRQAKLIRGNKIGTLLIAAPVALLLLSYFLRLNVGDRILLIFASLLGSVVPYLLIPSMIIGIVILIRNK